MQPLIVLIIIAIAIGTLSFLGKLPKTGEVTPAKEATTQISSPSGAKISSAPTTQSLSEVKSSWIDTLIVSGPKEGEVINDTNKVTFEFEAVIYPKETEGKITFETKVEGVDKDWIKTSSQKRTITFPAGPKEYTFLVRAKINEIVDSAPAQRTFKINVSPYFGKITISNARIQSSSRPSLITLSTNLNQGEEINITGWQIYGKKGSFFIPQGIEKYSPYNPEATDNIIIKQGDRIYLSGTQNPLGRDRNFRPNKCLGYLTNYYDFPISLSKDCPKPTQEEISYLSDCCQKFISDLGKCKVPDYSDNQSIISDAECTAYLNQNLNYAACFNRYSQDKDFLKKEWNIYVGRDFVSQTLDTLYLKDLNGFVVDSYQYGCLICD